MGEEGLIYGFKMHIWYFIVYISVTKNAVSLGLLPNMFVSKME